MTMSPTPTRTVAEIDGFVDLLAVACEDTDLYRQLKRILELPDPTRKLVIRGLLQDMRRRNAPPDLAAAMACLVENDVAERAYEVIFKCQRGGLFSRLRIDGGDSRDPGRVANDARAPDRPAIGRVVMSIALAVAVVVALVFIAGISLEKKPVGWGAIDYADLVAREVERFANANYPVELATKQASGTVVLRLSVTSGGKLESVNVIVSSGNWDIDQAARALVVKAGDFPPFSASMAREYRSIEIARAFTFANRNVSQARHGETTMRLADPRVSGVAESWRRRAASGHPSPSPAPARGEGGGG